MDGVPVAAAPRLSWETDPMPYHQPPGTAPGHTSGVRTDAPIYARLIQERGDVPTQVRLAAEQALREVEQVMDFRLPHRLAAR